MGCRRQSAGPVQHVTQVQGAIFCQHNTHVMPHQVTVLNTPSEHREGRQKKQKQKQKKEIAQDRTWIFVESMRKNKKSE